MEQVQLAVAGSSRFRQKGEAIAARLEGQPVWIAAILILAYLAMIAMPVQRRLWHDELFTYYIAQAPDFHALIDQIRRLDLNPPMVYLVTRGWQALVGRNELLTRIPTVVAYLAAALAFWTFLRRRVGALWALAALFLVWSTPLFVYATELRPYGLLMMFFSLTLLSWDTATSSTRRGWALAGVVVGAVGMMLCHVFAIFPLGAIYLAELVRAWRSRRIDWPVWVCLLLPLATVLSYIPLMQKFEVEAFPSRFQGGVRRLSIFFARAALEYSLPFGCAVAAAFVARPFRFAGIAKEMRRMRAKDAGLALGLLSIPFLINVLLVRTRGAFFDRYALSTAMAIAAGAILLLALLTGWNRFAGACAALVLLVYGLFVNLAWPAATKPRIAPAAVVFGQFPASLPIVAASGLTFIEMDHYEPPNFLRRVYYLADRPSAIQYAHATTFEGIPILKRYFPIRANVAQFPDFVAQHPHFVVLGTMDYPEDWLLRKLRAEGASVEKRGTFYALPYKDYDVYEIRMGSER